MAGAGSAETGRSLLDGFGEGRDLPRPQIAGAVVVEDEKCITSLVAHPDVVPRRCNHDRIIGNATSKRVGDRATGDVLGSTVAHHKTLNRGTHFALSQVTGKAADLSSAVRSRSDTRAGRGVGRGRKIVMGNIVSSRCNSAPRRGVFWAVFSRARLTSIGWLTPLLGHCRTHRGCGRRFRLLRFRGTAFLALIRFFGALSFPLSLCLNARTQRRDGEGEQYHLNPASLVHDLMPSSIELRAALGFLRAQRAGHGWVEQMKNRSAISSRGFANYSRSIARPRLPVGDKPLRVRRAPGLGGAIRLDHSTRWLAHWAHQPSDHRDLYSSRAD